MSVDQVTLLFALLAIGAAALSAGIAVVAIGAARSAGWSERLERFRDKAGTTALLAATIVAIVTMAGSLYLSEVANFPPCRWCWYQRIAAYPLAPVLVLAFVRRDHAVRPYVWLLCILGAAMSIYHVLLERFPEWEGVGCDIDNPCSVRWVEQLGFITIPMMAGCAFVTMAALAWLAGPGRIGGRGPEPGDPTTDPTTRSED